MHDMYQKYREKSDFFNIFDIFENIMIFSKKITIFSNPCTDSFLWKKWNEIIAVLRVLAVCMRKAKTAIRPTVCRS